MGCFYDRRCCLYNWFCVAIKFILFSLFVKFGYSQNTRKKKIKKYSLSVPGKIVSYRYETEWVDNDDSPRSKFTYLSVTFDYFYQGVWYRVTKTYNSDISIVGLTDVTAVIDPKTMDVDIFELVNQNITLPANKRIALIMIFTVIFGLPLICLPVLFLCVLFSFM